MSWEIINYLIFTLTLIYTSYWIVINLFLSSFGRKKPPITTVKNKKIQLLVLKKTGVNIKAIRISESSHPFGMMVGIPTKPQLVLSRGSYDTFPTDEMEYVIIHEAEHYVLRHGLIEFAAGLFLFIIGILLIGNSSLFNPILSSFLGLIFGIFLIQLGKAHELQADKFTVKRISNPNGMIKATKKFRQYHGNKYSQNLNPIVQFLFYRANPYKNRIKMARNEIVSRTFARHNNP